VTRVLVDARLASRFESGISRYVTCIAEGFASGELGAIPYEPVFLLSRRAALKTLEPWRSVPVVETDVPIFGGREWLEMPRLIAAIGASAFHTTSFASFPVLRVPHMHTVHDLIHLQFGSIVEKLYYRLLRRSARRARVLATVSEAVRAELRDWTGRQDIEVQANAFDPAPVEDGAERPWLEKAGLRPGGYVLAVANEKRYKNLALLRAARADSGVSLPLAVAHEVLDRHDPDRASTLGFNALMRNARALFSPSLVEGFGRVPVEALLHGLPVVASDIPAHREVLHGVPAEVLQFVAPADRAGWVSAFKRVAAAAIDRPSEATRRALLAKYSSGALRLAVHRSYLALAAVGP
jgi:glycosyltransferase involved in cell wall biosynthesis